VQEGPTAVQGELVQGTAAVQDMAAAVELIAAAPVQVQGQVLSVVHAECHAEVVVAAAVCHTLAMVRDHTCRRPHTSTLVVVAISML